MAPSSSSPYVLNNPSTSDIPIPDHPYGIKRPLRVLLLGCGISGISFFKFAEQQASNLSIVCYDKNPGVGGTWLENRYPGCACDVPSVIYQFPWRPAPWSKYYSHAPEIHKYLDQVASENDFVRKYVKLNHEVKSLSFDSATGRWTAVVQDLHTNTELTDTADFVLNCSGVLNKWKWPVIEGLDSFKGTLLHSAQWDQSTDLKGKSVALIGAGSSAVQILPNIYGQVEHVYTWIRSKIWITAGFAQKFAGKDGANFAYSEEQRQLFERPDEYKAYCKMIENEMNQRFKFIINGTQAQKDAVDFSRREMEKKLGDRADLLKSIMPTDFFVGCRRPTPGNGYLESLVGEKTTAYCEQLGRITERGFVDPEGVERDVDVIICATGFDTSYVPRVKIVVDGKDMNEQWKGEDGPAQTYMSVTLTDVPNYLVFGGAYCPAAHGSFFTLMQCYSEYALQVLDKMQVENIKSIKPKRKAAEQFLRHADTFLKRTAWTGPCRSWFKGGRADAKPAIWPGTRLHFLKLLEKVRFEDYDIEHVDEDNVYGFLGNGFHAVEFDGSDSTWYLGAPEKAVDEKKILEIMEGTRGIELAKPWLDSCC